MPTMPWRNDMPRDANGKILDLSSFRSVKHVIVDRAAEKKKERMKGKKPPVIKWRDTKLLRSHAISSAVREILIHASQIDFTRINLIGQSGSGKSTLGMTLAHMIHQKAMKLDDPIPFAVKVFTKDDLANFKTTIGELDPNLNHILIFDDVSFMQSQFSRQQILSIESNMTTVRHMKGGEDKKIILIMNFHYSMALQKFLRDCNFAFYTTIGNSDFDNVIKTWNKGRQATMKMKAFRKLVGDAKMTKQFRGVITRKNRRDNTMIKYDYKKPFAPVLFISESTTHTFVFPKREWIDPHCMICDDADKRVAQKQENIEEVLKALEKAKFGKQNLIQGVRCLALLQGKNVYPDNVRRVIIFLQRYNKEHNINLDSLCEHFGLVEKNVKYRSCQTLPKEDDKNG